MSVLDQEEFIQLRKFKGKTDKEEVRKILDEIEEQVSKGVSLRSSIIFTYANYVEEIRKNKDFYSLISAILEKYSPKLGIENVMELIISTVS
ncbi:hypothetical protein [Acidianus sp. HS-5]|uniref:hypothetical protein n=1 Tax=Acidianus sp. HS-5 TaxID=2886040 RepID=UPI001F2410FD|nr:hypothetical protein [Acidianus sp. HS-5]BDC19951.1 hypothetical protein HS5_28410 [Acidianus sp. HS-5]